MRIHRFFFSLIIVRMIFSGGAFAQDRQSLTVIDLSEQPPFSLNAVNDSIQLSAAAALDFSAIICDKVFHIKANNFENWDSDAEYRKLPLMDSFFMRPYSKAFDYAGTGFAALAILSPAIMLTSPKSQWLTVGVMYAETLMWAYGIKEWGKLLVHRARPYMYFDGFPEAKVDDGDWNCSFPSGHTTLSFAGAAFTTYLFNQYFPDNPWRFAVTGISFGLAGTVGALRMASGNHFFTDVLAGAVIGTVCGFAVPFMHSQNFYGMFRKKNTELTVTPTGFSARIQLD